jgi:flagellar hook-associated protein 1 FlgK
MQNALSTVNHNITNANTPGYSRQRLDLAAEFAYTEPTPSQLSAGQIGQGPVVQQITRSRDAFLDSQYRLANGKLGNNSAARDALQQIEGILNEPSTSSINTSLQNFFDAAQDMSLHPESTATRANYLQQAIDMVTVFQQQATQLQALRQNLVGDPLVPSSFTTSQLSINVTDVNSKLAAIAEINKNIVSIKASGAQPNDLLDQRDKLLDDLSQIVDIQVTNYDNGQIDLSIGGEIMIKGVDQVDSLEAIQNPGPAPTSDDVPALVKTVNGGVTLNDGAGSEITSGKLKGILDMGGNDPTLSTVRGVLGQLNNLLDTIVTQINNLQAAGRDQNGNLAPAAIFQANAALNPGQPLSIFHWEVNPAVVADPSKVAAAIDDTTVAGGFAGVGDGRNALAMAQLRDQTFAALGTGFVDYLNGTVSKLGIDSRSYQNSTTTQGNLVQSLDTQRQSVSGVNVDEETIDLLRYQRAFEATSKTVNILNEVYQTIIGMVS